MAQYTKQFVKPYPDGYIDKPVMTTPVTADILNMHERVLAALEDFLASDDVGFKKGLTVGSRYDGIVGVGSLVLGYGLASGLYSCVIGTGTASGAYSFVSGANAEASGYGAHAKGTNTISKGDLSCTEGFGTIAAGELQHVQGRYNVEDAEGVYAHIVGGGTSAADRKNIHTLDWQGNAIFAGNVTDGNGDSIAGLKGEIPKEEAVDIDFSNYFT